MADPKPAYRARFQSIHFLCALETFDVTQVLVELLVQSGQVIKRRRSSQQLLEEKVSKLEEMGAKLVTGDL